MSTTAEAGTSRPIRRPNQAVAHPGGGSSRWGLAVLIVLVSVYVQTQSSNFITEANIQTIILNVSSLLIAATAAMRLVVSGNVDLSIGGQLSLLSVLCALVARDTQNPVLAVAVGLAGGAVLGLINGTAVRLLSISPLIVTLGLSFVYFGLAFALSDSTAVFGFPNSFLTVGLSSMAGIPTPVWVALVFFALGSLHLSRTTSGIRRYAIGGTPRRMSQ
jgi:ribose/xylose/arabinose/galactoside ABC-type transport system permease subunit